VRDSLVSPAFRSRVRRSVLPLAERLGHWGVSPNGLTITGFALALVAAGAAATGAWLPAGILVLAGGTCDLLDGAVARATGRQSAFGAFLDSTLDRWGEGLLYAGIIAGTAGAGFVAGAALAGVALAAASTVTYARARAESLGVSGEVGLAPRPERLLIVAAGLVGSGLAGGIGSCPPAPVLACAATGKGVLAVALGLIALLATITTVQRIVHVRGRLREEVSRRS
jgi:CDP-diacylglycerol--glycerol-3-phosphate 3-phosphatidyltransferase